MLMLSLKYKDLDTKYDDSEVIISKDMDTKTDVAKVVVSKYLDTKNSDEEIEESNSTDIESEKKTYLRLYIVILRSLQLLMMKLFQIFFKICLWKDDRKDLKINQKNRWQ